MSEEVRYVVFFEVEVVGRWKRFRSNSYCKVQGVSKKVRVGFQGREREGRVGNRLDRQMGLSFVEFWRLYQGMSYFKIGVGRRGVDMVKKGVDQKGWG